MGHGLGVVGLFKLQNNEGVLKETISLVASNALDADLIQNLTRAIAEEERWLSGALPGLSRIPPDQPENAGIPWHAGALAYYKPAYPNPTTEPSATEPPAIETQTAQKTPTGRLDIFVIYLGSAEVVLDDSGNRQIDRACNYATEQGATNVIVNGLADLMSLDASGLQFSDTKAQATLDQLRTRGGCRNAVIVQEHDGKTFTERYDPDVPVSTERRLEVGVILDR